MSVKDPKTLPLPETLQIEELVAFHSNSLMKLKEAGKKINDADLRQIYTKNIRDLELTLSELIHFSILYLYNQVDKP